MFVRKTDFDNVVKLLSDRRNTHSLEREMDVLRSCKSKNEIKVMRQAGAISGKAMSQVMRAVQPGMEEAQAQALFEQGHVRVGPDTITDPAFLVTRSMEDFVTWVDTSKIRRAIANYNDELDDFDLL